MSAETFTDPRVPDRAQRVVGWLAISEIKGHDGRVWTFKPANVVFLDGGSLYWFELPDTLCVMHVSGGGEIVRYPGEWAAASQEAPKAEDSKYEPTDRGVQEASQGKGR